MNASRDPEESSPHSACINLGSNIHPIENIPRAIQMLRGLTRLEALSSSWETQAVGSDGPNFINIAALVQTDLSAAELKKQVIGAIEQALGRVRSVDKNAPRTIDLDIVVYDGEVLDPHLFERVYVALPVSELMPGLPHPRTGEPLSQVAAALRERDGAALWQEIDFH